MARITVEDCMDKFESRFELVLVASNRARKLHSGENPTIEKDNDKNTVIALREIADETISIDDMKNSLVEEYQTVSSQTEEDLSLEYSDSDNQNDVENNQEVNEAQGVLTDKEDEIENFKEINIDSSDQTFQNIDSEQEIDTYKDSESSESQNENSNQEIKEEI